MLFLSHRNCYYTIYIRRLFINNVDFCCENVISDYRVTINVLFCFGIQGQSLGAISVSIMLIG